MQRFRNWKISKKILSITFFGIIALFCFLLMSKSSLDRHVYAEREHSMQEIVESSYSIIEDAHNQVKQGKMTKEEAQTNVLHIIRKIRFGESGYLWINDMAPKMIMHPIKPELDGKDLSDHKDPNGKKLFMEFVKIVQEQKECVVSYMWPKPGFAAPVEKISYVKGFAPWGWIIGSGEYINDIQRTLKSHFLISLATMLLISVCYVLLSLYISRRISKPITDLSEVMEKLAEGRTKIEFKENASNDEVGYMAHSLQGLAKKIIQSYAMQTSLSSVSSALMILDENNIISYVNPKMTNTYDDPYKLDQ